MDNGPLSDTVLILILMKIVRLQRRWEISDSESLTI